MADMEFDEFDGGMSRNGRGRMGRVVHLAGAVCSLALVLGLAVWGYRLAVRDVTGIPVMRAIGGAMRVAPENPGGKEAENQGLSVNAVAAAGTAMPLSDQVVLAPKAIDLTVDDVAGLATTEAPPASDVATDQAAAANPEIATDLAASDGVVSTSNTDGVAMALAEALADEGGPSDTAGSTADTALAAIDAAPDQTASPVRSPRPRLRSDVVTSSSGTAAPSVEVDPSTIPVGTRLVQLGAFDDAETARGEWAKLQARFSELLASKSMVIQSAQSGGRTFFRLRATGFDGEDDARRFCVALLAENVSCIPVAQR